MQCRESEAVWRRVQRTCEPGAAKPTCAGNACNRIWRRRFLQPLLLLMLALSLLLLRPLLLRMLQYLPCLLLLPQVLSLLLASTACS